MNGKRGSMWFDVWWSQMCGHRVKTCWKQTTKPRPQIGTFQVKVVSRCSRETDSLPWLEHKVQRLFSPLWAETIPTVLHPEVYRGYFAGCCAKRTVSPEQQQLHLGGVMLWYSVYSSLTSFYSEEILWRWLILELEQVHSNLLLLLGEPRGPCREESSNVAHSTVKHKQPEKEHLIEREENCELWVQLYHLDAENLSLLFNSYWFNNVKFAWNCLATLGKARDDVGDLLYYSCTIEHFFTSHSWNI